MIWAANARAAIIVASSYCANSI